ncbi:MAG: sodium:solute symporter family transporter, partial [Akkermansiaceae bacterium]
MRLFILLGICFLSGLASAGDAIKWSSEMPPLPDEYGYAGGYSAIVGEGESRTLVFAGGANFPYKNPFDEAKNANNGQPKVFHNTAFSISLAAEGLTSKGEWKSATPLPMELAYGASVSLPHDHSALFIGGNAGADGAGRSAKVYRVTTQNGTISYTAIADLPVGVTNIAATLVDQTVYVFSGNSLAGSEQQFLALDTSNSDSTKWQWELLSWPERSAGVPARARGNYTIGNMAGKVYVFAGRSAHDPADDSMQKVDINEMHKLDFFRDCYAYSPKAGSWKRIADLPMGISAAPSNAVPAGYSHLLMLGGVPVEFLRDLLDVEKYPTLNAGRQGFDHPGFPRDIWGYHYVTNTWAKFGKVPESMRSTVTAPVVIDGAEFIVPSGEWSPKLRSNAMRVGKIAADRPSFGAINWVVVCVYLLGMVLVGYWFMKKEAASSTDDYFRGGQRIPWWVAGLSIFATVLSSITFMAIPAVAYSDNWNRWIGQWPILVLVPLVVFFYLPFFRKLNLTSAYEYLEARFNLVIRLIASTSF